MRHLTTAFATLALSLCPSAVAQDPAATPRPADLVWTSPSKDAAGSMPIGNGVLGANVWVEPEHGLRILLSRTDTWSEANRLLKVGRLDIRFDPNPFAAGAPFIQRLAFARGVLEIEAGTDAERFQLAVFVDADAPILRIVGTSRVPRTMHVVETGWRAERRLLRGEELPSSWTMRDAPPSIEVAESADMHWSAELGADLGTLGWFHRNEASIVPLTLRHQGLESIAATAIDPLLRRTFGALVAATDCARHDSSTLTSTSPRTSFSIRVATHTAQTDTAESWQGMTRTLLERAPSDADARRATEASWEAFWRRSWIRTGAVRHPDARVSLEDAYAWTRFMIACAGKGDAPIKFNGSIFTVEPKVSGGPDLDPDWRRWGGDFWWQNTRLPYHAMLAAGDFDSMDPLFRLYERALPLCRARARLYHDVDGAYFPETMTTFGTYSNGDYGWDRTGHVASDVLCPYWQWAWNQGPELVALMLDHFDYTGDGAFVRERVVPLARDVIAYFDSRFGRDERGALRITPTQALETHWYGVIDDMPSVAGLRAITARLLALPEGLLGASDRERWTTFANALPPLPLREVDGAMRLVAAAEFDPSRQNCEAPELAAVFPFRLATQRTALRDAARAAYAARVDRFEHGWPQDGQNAALLGLVEEARRIVLAKTTNGHPAHRFPIIWGPNFDWLPDHCHAGNLMQTLQLMLLQCEGDAIALLPAWPRAWDVAFKLHAPHQTTVEAELKGGKLVRLVVEPPARQRDVILPEDLR